MKKVKNTFLLLIAVIGISSSLDAQTTLNLRNDTDCSMDIKVKYGTAPCTGSTTPINVTLAANTSQDVTIPNGNSVRNIKVDTPGASTTVSIICSSTWQQTTVGQIECLGVPVTVDFVSSVSLQITD